MKLIVESIKTNDQIIKYISSQIEANNKTKHAIEK